MRTIDKIVQEIEAEAEAWLKEAAPWLASPGPVKTATFGPGRGTTLSVQYDEVRENWHILATGPADPHQGGIPRTPESALRAVREGTRMVLETMEETMLWLRSRSVDLRAVADEVTVAEVMEG